MIQNEATEGAGDIALRTAGEIAQLVQMACVWDVCAPKPGNVSRERDFSDATMEDFLLSAIAIGPAFENADTLSVGEIILRAIEDTHRVVRSNTNLGIVLLLAPLVKACCGASDPGAIRSRLRGCLMQLDVEDARRAYAAIRIAKPGGMGRVSEADISEEPSLTLLEAMQLAAVRDSIAREYASDFELTFGVGLPALKRALSEGADFSRAVVQCSLTILSREPDTLIARKTDMETARRVSIQAEAVLACGGVFTPEGSQAIKTLDRTLRDPAHALNPGTTADLTAAAIFLALLEKDRPHASVLKAQSY